MQTSDADISTALTPPEDEPAQQTLLPKSAAGFPSIVSTMKYSIGRMGVGRALKTLARVNQKDGFDCQSCAWPSPDENRHFAEFCENGARAVADEATTRRVTPEFFRRWSISQLAAQSDHWLNQQGRLTEPMLRRHGSDHY